MIWLIEEQIAYALGASAGDERVMQQAEALARWRYYATVGELLAAMPPSGGWRWLFGFAGGARGTERKDQVAMTPGGAGLEPGLEPVVWADEASPFTGPQVRALLDENEKLRSDKKQDPVITSLRAQFELRKFERRERLAAMCLQGLLADTEFTCAPNEAATKAVNYADTLIKELGEPFL